MKSGQKRPADFAFEGMPAPWMVLKQNRDAVKEYDDGSKCTASTVDSFSSFDYSSSSSFSSLYQTSSTSTSTSTSTTSRSSHHQRSVTTTTTTTKRKIETKPPSVTPTTRNGNGTRNHPTTPKTTQAKPTTSSTRIPKALPAEPTITSSARIPKALRDHCACNEGSYWTKPTTKRRRSFSGRYSTKMVVANDPVVPLIKNSRTCSSGSSRARNDKPRRHRKSTNSISDSWPTRYDSSKNHQASTNQTVKIIGIPGVRSRWAWVDNHIHAKNNIHIDAKNNIHIDAKKKNEICHGPMSNSLKAIRDYCGKGNYWMEPTQRRKHVSPECFTYTKPAAKEKTQQSIVSKTPKGVEVDGSRNSNSNSSSSSSNNNNHNNRGRKNTNLPPRAKRQKRIRNETAENLRDRAESTTTQVSDSGTQAQTETTTQTTTTTETSISAAKSTATTPIFATKEDSHQPKTRFRAMEGPNQPIAPYALDLISLVCNSYHKHRCWPLQQVHRVLDKPLPGYTTETESEKERLMRLQFRQRFASAASTGMSPIEFAKKLLGLWGGRLEVVVAAVAAVASEEVNNKHVLDNTVGTDGNRQT